jgi:hypothetical protein
VQWHNQIAIGQRLEERRDGGQNGRGQMISLYSKKFDKKRKNGTDRRKVPGAGAASEAFIGIMKGLCLMAE